MLLPELIGSLIPTGLIYFALRFWLFKSGWTAAPATAACVVLATGMLRALGDADGGAPDLAAGVALMAVPTAVFLIVDLVRLRGGAIKRRLKEPEDRGGENQPPPDA
ncbi:hypothetical protein [Maricaulis sp.]|uniref:hypothetical protein n=1 Tax=Maricaulis sp. TaxID=1486257 RepID=UPI003A94B434